jgi:phosphoribosylanthranilate isomerase
MSDIEYQEYERIQSHKTHPRPRVKICGISRVEDALSALEAGADALGFIFYAKSPRNVSPEQARAIIARLPSGLAKVGVFVDEDFPRIMDIVYHCGLSGVQLHGEESPELVLKLKRQNLTVIKVLFAGKFPGFDRADDYQPSAFLVECGQGVLPGGNAMTWNWQDARNLPRQVPLILAGGLSPENVAEAVHQALPDAVDVSSGVEFSPGIKNPEKIRRFIQALPQGPAGQKVF